MFVNIIIFVIFGGFQTIVCKKLKFCCGPLSRNSGGREIDSKDAAHLHYIDNNMYRRKTTQIDDKLVTGWAILPLSLKKLLCIFVSVNPSTSICNCSPD
jgi:hypothetical protein